MNRRDQHQKSCIQRLQLPFLMAICFSLPESIIAQQAATPTFSPNGGYFTTALPVAVTDTTANATIHYTTDGSSPAETNSVIAAGGLIFVDRTKTLKAAAWATGLTSSEVASASFRITGAAECGGYHTLALRSDGSVWLWGFNGDGELGNNTTTNQLTPFWLSSVSNIVSVAAGDYHSVAADDSGNVWNWGGNWYGELGNGTTNRSLTPVAVTGITNAVAVSGGGYHTVALLENGTVRAWGYGVSGELGNGQHTNNWTPVTVSGLSNVVSIAAGGYHTLALKSDGSVWAWGWNWYYQLGDSNRWLDGSSPIQVPGLSNVVVIAAGDYHSLAITADGNAWGWGADGYGSLGDGTNVHRAAPSLVTGMTNALALAGGAYHTIAARTDGTVWGWGSNYYKQLGDGTSVDRWTPVHTGNLSNAVFVAAGGHSSLAILKDGTIWGWGVNNNGQLGTAYSTYSSPVLQTTNNTRLVWWDDPDGDGLATWDEIARGTNPDNSDTDGDGMSDGWEVAHGYNPTSAEPNADYDGDGMPNWWELKYSPALDPLVADGANNPDGDDANNLTEYLQGRDPTKGAVSDSGGLVNLNVFTPLE